MPLIKVCDKGMEPQDIDVVITSDYSDNLRGASLVVGLLLPNI